MIIPCRTEVLTIRSVVDGSSHVVPQVQNDDDHSQDGTAEGVAREGLDGDDSGDNVPRHRGGRHRPGPEFGTVVPTGTVRDASW